MKELSFDEMMDTMGGGLCTDIAIQIVRCTIDGDWYCVGYLAAMFAQYCTGNKY
jgi:hypothetical protein